MKEFRNISSVSSRAEVLTKCNIEKVFEILHVQNVLAKGNMQDDIISVWKKNLELTNVNFCMNFTSRLLTEKKNWKILIYNLNIILKT